MKRYIAVLAVLPTVVLGGLLTGCYSNGNSYYLTDGPTHRYLTLAACEREAMARYRDGGPVYSGYKCYAMALGSVLETHTYYNGQPARRD